MTDSRDLKHRETREGFLPTWPGILTVILTYAKFQLDARADPSHVLKSRKTRVETAVKFNMRNLI